MSGSQVFEQCVQSDGFNGQEEIGIEDLYQEFKQRLSEELYQEFRQRFVDEMGDQLPTMDK